MPEHTDPFRQLENFGTGGIVTTPLEPTEVRRLGNKHRTQRRARISAAVAAVVVAAVVPVAVIASSGDGKAVDPTKQPTVTITPSPTPTVITYPGDGVTVSTPEEVSKLSGTSDDFKTFVADQARRAQEYGDANCPDAAHSVTVKKWSSAGYAIGGYNDCGGYAALWAQQNGTWIQGEGGQDVWNCTTLKYLGVPTSFAGECAAEAGGFGPTGTETLTLGMTKAQIEATGASVVHKTAGSSCSELVESPQPSGAPNGIDGQVDNTHGLIQINARPDDITPERISLGSTYAEVKAAYPTVKREADGWVVPLANHAEYRMEFDGLGADSTVVVLILEDTRFACAG